MHLRGARRELPCAHELLRRRNHIDQEVAGIRLIALVRPEFGLRRVAQPLVGRVEAARVELVKEPIFEPLALEEVGLGQQLRARRRGQARALEAATKELQD